MWVEWFIVSIIVLAIILFIVESWMNKKSSDVPGTVTNVQVEIHE